LFSGFISPTRYFIESLTVAELRCLPEQSGFTQTEIAFSYPEEANLFYVAHLARNDAGVSNQSCSGWYWGAVPALLVGLTIRILAAGCIHVSGRSQQAKRPLVEELRKPPEKNGPTSFTRIRVAVTIFVAIFVLMFGLASWTIIRTVGSTRRILPEELTEEDFEGFISKYGTYNA